MPFPRNDAFSFWKLEEHWQEALEPEIERSEKSANFFLYEQYLSGKNRRPPATMQAYYRVKSLIPEQLRHHLNSAAVRLRRKNKFPRWPCETVLVDFWATWLRESLQTLGVNDGWHIGFWPGGAKCCIVLTHDVESSAGLARMEQVADLEEHYGFRSAWNLPLEQFPIDWNLIERLRSRGFEFGAHGLCHDGRLFRSQSDFTTLAPILRQLSSAHQLRGFRAPSTLRRAEWIEQLGFDFDCSFADSDPYEPQPGGTCSLFPFFLSSLVELPYTLAQDHTLINILRCDPLPIWIAKAHAIESIGGMMLTLIHPDYCRPGRELRNYEKLLERFREIDGAWHARPSEVAEWWLLRDGLRLSVEDDRPVIRGIGAERAIARRLSNEPLANLGW